MGSRAGIIRSGGFLIVCLACTAGAIAGGLKSRLEARMIGSPAMRAKAVYIEEQRNDGRLRQKLNIEVERAKAGQKFEVFADGVRVGTATANGLGIAKLELFSGGDNPNPSKIPPLAPGDVVRIGGMSGVLSTR